MRKVKVRAIIEYEVEYPDDWDDEMVLFHRNDSDSSWCCSNIMRET